jgi:hypothetical protein
MKKQGNRLDENNNDRSSSSPATKRPWQKPKLRFVKPKLTKHGKLEEVTGQFFGAFTPTER